AARDSLSPSSRYRRLIDLRRSPIAQRLVRTRVVVEDEVPAQSTSQFGNFFVSSDIDVFVFHRPPQTFDKDVVQSPPPTIHAHRHSGGFQPPGERLGRELHALVRVEDLGLSPI